MFDSPFWDGLSAEWRAAIGPRFTAAEAASLESIVRAERKANHVLPAPAETFEAFRLTSPGAVKIVLLGQDPYPTPGDAHGLAFSVRPGVRTPRSLANVLRERHDDLGLPVPRMGDLTAWAGQGVLLLNTVLTVRAGEAGSHRGRGWEPFSDAVIAAVSEGPERVVFLLWGNDAHRKAGRIDASRHTILTAAHPSPLSARRGFFGHRPFSKSNQALEGWGRGPIDWRLPGDGE